jgi:hypothetical protein
VSAIPRQNSHNKKNHVTSTSLYAANGTKIETYGTYTMQVNFGLRRLFSWPFIIADVTQPNIGADFLHHHNIMVDLKKRRLLDGTTGLTVAGILSSNPSTGLSTINRSSVDQYSAVLREFPTVTKQQIDRATTHHDVEHDI